MPENEPPNPTLDFLSKFLAEFPFSLIRWLPSMAAILMEAWGFWLFFEYQDPGHYRKRDHSKGITLLFAGCFLAIVQTIIVVAHKNSREQNSESK